MRVFLQNCAEIKDYKVVGIMRVWSTLISAEDEVVFPFYTVEETAAWSPDPFCRHCDDAGWGHHYVCMRKYHFIIPEKENWGVPLGEIDESQSNYLHGLIHCNGYGHVISVNGWKNESNFFSADDTMEFWERFCTVLRARYISARHSSRGEGIELSLIYGAAYGETWLEEWGYKLSRQIPKITEEYRESIQSLCSLSLDHIISDLTKKGIDTKSSQEIINVYRHSSESPLVTISDLLKLILDSQSRVPKDVSTACENGAETGENSPMTLKMFADSLKNSKWTVKRLEKVLDLIVKELKKHRANNGQRDCPISRKKLKEEVIKNKVDTGLVNYVLSGITCFTADDLIIRRAIDPHSTRIEFTIEEVTKRTNIRPRLGLSMPQDIHFLYDNVLSPLTESQMILRDFHFVKDRPIEREIKKNKMELTSMFSPSSNELASELPRPLSPGVVVVVDPLMNFRELKMEAQRALRDTYRVLKDFEVTQIGLDEKDDEQVLKDNVDPGRRFLWEAVGSIFQPGFGMKMTNYEDEGMKIREELTDCIPF